MSMTVGDLASYAYGKFAFTGSSAYKQAASAVEGLSKTDFNVSSLSDAVDAMQGTLSGGSAYGITNLDGYVRDSFTRSQLTEYNALSGTAADASSYASGTAQSAASIGYLANKAGKDAGAVDLYGVVTPGESAQIALMSEGVAGIVGGVIGAYQNYLGSSMVGGLLDVSA